MNNLERFKENLTALLGEENFEQFQDFFRVKSVGRDLSLALTTLGLVFICPAYSYLCPVVRRIPTVKIPGKAFFKSVSRTSITFKL